MLTAQLSNALQVLGELLEGRMCHLPWSVLAIGARAPAHPLDRFASTRTGTSAANASLFGILVFVACLGHAVYLLNEGSRCGWCQESSQTWAEVILPWKTPHSFYKALLNRKLFADTLRSMQVLIGLLSNENAAPAPASTQPNSGATEAHLLPADTSVTARGERNKQRDVGALRDAGFGEGRNVSDMGIGVRNDENAQPAGGHARPYEVMPFLNAGKHFILPDPC